jgi:C4-dicarboxylate-specific signal transduction histidine kinase
LSALAMRLSLLRQDTSLAVSQKQNADAMARILRTCTTRLGTLRWFAIDPVDSADPVDLGDIVDGALEVVETLFDSARPVRAAVALPVLPTVKGCAAELCDVFVNLMINARDAMASGGTIRISGAIEPRYVMVAIEDEGPGIPPDHAERIFEPFFTTKGKGGTGLGLANARRTLQRFGGSIRATNRAGGGARFELRFVPRG